MADMDAEAAGVGTADVDDSPHNRSGAEVLLPPARKEKRKAHPLPTKDEELEGWEGPGLRRIKKRRETIKEEEAPELEPLEVLGSTVQASIVAKFEHSYLLQVQLGRETLHGVLYHAPPEEESFPLILPPVITTGLALEGGQVVIKRPPKKKSEEGGKRDPNAPKPARTGYNFFFSEARERDREINPGRGDQERSAAIGEQWRKMSAREREPYQDMGHKDKERYTAEQLKVWQPRNSPQGKVPPKELPLKPVGGREPGTALTTRR